jgi:4,5-DOPA dioxygenase extradiol
MHTQHGSGPVHPTLEDLPYFRNDDERSMPGGRRSAVSDQPMPAAFLGHGSPMNTLARNRYTEAWRLFGRTIPRPRAILAISAHWYINATAVTAMERPRTIHDFFARIPKLDELRYPAPGSPSLAEQVADIVKPRWVGQDFDAWGLDHGTWSVLAHVFPDADVPVVQLSINATKPWDYHLELGARLAPLRQDGVLVVASGNVVHNLRRVRHTMTDTGFDWAQRFDEDAQAIMLDQPTEAAGLTSHPDFAAAAPTPDHFIPLLYLAGLAGAASHPTDILVDGYAAGSLSMTAYTLGVDCPATEATGSAASLPAGLDPEDINV